MIINVNRETFGGTIRNGDLIAVANIIEHLRKINNNPSMRFWIDPSARGTEGYCQEFYNFMLLTTDYFSDFQGTETLPWKKVNIWDFRDICGDLVSIPNSAEMKKKIVIFPLTDAPYNTYRNWPEQLLPQLIEKYSSEEYNDYEKIICAKNIRGVTKKEWKVSSSMSENLVHIMESEIFIGGDTGTTHFAFALAKPPQDLLYYGSSRALLHTLPFYLLQGKGRMYNYWLDFEGSSWV